MIDSESAFKFLINAEAHKEMWKGLIYSDAGFTFLDAAALQYGHVLSEGRVVDETGRPVEGKDLVSIIDTAATQAMVEKPLWKVQ